MGRALCNKWHVWRLAHVLVFIIGVSVALLLAACRSTSTLDFSNGPPLQVVALEQVSDSSQLFASLNVKIRTKLQQLCLHGACVSCTVALHAPIASTRITSSPLSHRHPTPPSLNHLHSTLGGGERPKLKFIHLHPRPIRTLASKSEIYLVRSYQLRSMPLFVQINPSGSGSVRLCLHAGGGGADGG